MTLPILSPELASFCQSGVSIVIAARGSDGSPIAGLALACRADVNAQRLRIILGREANLALLHAVEQGSAIAATLTQPGSHRSIQFKGPLAQTDPVEPEDHRHLAEQFDAFCRILVNIGYSEAFARAYHGHRPEDLVALSFTPVDAFLQTPGPDAGSILR